jgi:hypothetical protein
LPTSSYLNRSRHELDALISKDLVRAAEAKTPRSLDELEDKRAAPLHGETKADLDQVDTDTDTAKRPKRLVYENNPTIR